MAAQARADVMVEGPASIVAMANGLWTPIVDHLVDENRVGSNENGFGWNIGGTDFFPQCVSGLELG